MNRTRQAIGATLPLAMLVALGAAAHSQQKPKKPTGAKPASPTTTTAFEREVAPLVKKYCVSCHSAPNGTGGVSLSAEKTFAAALKNRAVWDRVAPAVLEGRMPPPNMPQPTPTERARLGQALESLFSQIDCQLNDPGRVTMRRLNRAEYNNTIRDLLGVTLRPADEFPNDDVGYGFDNIGDVLSISPLLMEKYLAAAEKVAEEAIVPPGTGSRPVRMTARQLAGLGGGGGSREGFQLGRTGDTATATFDFPVAGTYTIRIEAYEDYAEPRHAQLGLALDGKQLQKIEVVGTAPDPKVTTLTVAIEQPGKHKLSATFLNNNDRDPQDLPFRRQGQDRNLYINYIEQQPPAGLKRGLSFALPKDDTEAAWDAAAHAVLGPLAKRAFRRPPTVQEKTKLVALTHLAREKKTKSEFPEGLQLAVRAILSSPSFLFRPEPDAKPNDPTARRQLNDYELATRLSYFLWSSMPDDELLRLADAGKLKDTQTLIAQAKRMMRDPKAAALAENFAGQWLQLRKLATVQPDDKTFTPELRSAMETEALRFFTGIVQEDRSILEFLEADYTYLNGTLAEHYGIETTGLEGQTFRRVALGGNKQRGGLLSMAAVLTLTSNPSRTSPVKRGKWILDNLLGTPPPPPPPNVPELEAQKGATQAETLRKRMELHRTNPACASCHAQMDPIGLALENYDLVGRWRLNDGGKPIETAGILPDGSKFSGQSELKKVLLQKKSKFTRTLTDRLLTYALGRGIERTDKCNLDTMTKTVENKGYKFSAIVEAVVTSTPFRERRGDESGKKVTKS